MRLRDTRMYSSFQYCTHPHPIVLRERCIKEGKIKELASVRIPVCVVWLGARVFFKFSFVLKFCCCWPDGAPTRYPSWQRWEFNLWQAASIERVHWEAHHKRKRSLEKRINECLWSSNSLLDEIINATPPEFEVIRQKLITGTFICSGNIQTCVSVSS